MHESTKIGNTCEAPTPGNQRIVSPAGIGEEDCRHDDVRTVAGARTVSVLKYLDKRELARNTIVRRNDGNNTATVIYLKSRWSCLSWESVPGE